MLSRPGSCCKAVQRHIRTGSDAVWITDDLLSRILHRFCLTSQLSRRDASSVPGPLECRRRLGKRRMANLSPTTQPLSSDFGALWGMSRTVDGTQWKWEAPSTRRPPPIEIVPPQLPSWLSGYQPAPLEGLQHTLAPQASPSSLEESTLVVLEDSSLDIRKIFNTGSSDQIAACCDTFSQNLKQNLVLGLVPDNLLITHLRDFTHCMQRSKSSDMEVRTRCLQLYWATWEGIKACKVLRPADIGGGVLNQLLCLLAQLTCTQTTQIMANEIVWAASSDQICEMEEGILAVVRAWTTGWTRLKLVDGQIENGTYMVFESNHPAYVTRVLEQSVKDLARFLGRLSPASAPRIIHASTNHIISACLKDFKGGLRTLRAMRYSWVSVVANLPCTDEDLLIKTWTIMEFSDASAKENGFYAPSIPRLTMREGCDLLLDFWTSQGQIKAPETVRKTFKASILQHIRPDYAGLLLLALEQSRERCWSKASSLLRFLRRLGKPHAVYHVLRNLQGLGIKLPAHLFAMEIKELSCVDPRCALNIYKIYHKLRCDNLPLLLDGCPELIIAMVYDPDFDPAEIWGALRIPLYDPLRMKMGRKSLPRARITLVHRMALAFAQADCRSPRVALRNVMQCVLYLRRHRVPLTADVTRALSHTGITRDLLGAPWVRTGKVSWIIDLIRRVEGEEVAAKMDNVVNQCRNGFAVERQRLRRRGNPLGVGVID